MIRAVVALLALALPGAAAAADCKTITDPAARLACFDKPAPKAAATKPAADPFAAVKAEIAKTLKHPGSAIFADLSRSMRPNMKGVPTDTVCGTVNAKNGYGGYTGAKKFVYFPSDNTVHIAGGALSLSDVDTIVVGSFCK